MIGSRPELRLSFLNLLQIQFDVILFGYAKYDLQCGRLGLRALALDLNLKVSVS